MSQPVRAEDFTWVNFDQIDLKNCDDHGDKDKIVEVHNELPLAPEKIKIEAEMTPHTSEMS